MWDRTTFPLLAAFLSLCTIPFSNGEYTLVIVIVVFCTVALTVYLEIERYEVIVEEGRKEVVTEETRKETVTKGPYHGCTPVTPESIEKARRKKALAAAAYFDAEETHTEAVSCSIIYVDIIRNPKLEKKMLIDIAWEAFGEKYIDKMETSMNFETGKPLSGSRIFKLYAKTLIGRTGTCHYNPETLELIDTDKIVWSK